jgi:FkbM family methyltransferase
MHEPFIFDIIENLEPSNKIALDIGAHQGTISKRLSKKFKTVYAFEPHPQNIKKMHFRGIDENVIIIPQAISNNNIPVKLFLNNNPYMHTLSNDMAKTYQDFDFIEVEATTIDEFCKDKDIGFIKCDIEGAEEFVFDTAINTLKNNKMNVIVEFHKGVSKNKIISLFQEYDYRIKKTSTISDHILFSNINNQ